MRGFAVGVALLMSCQASARTGTPKDLSHLEFLEWLCWVQPDACTQVQLPGAMELNAPSCAEVHASMAVSLDTFSTAEHQLQNSCEGQFSYFSLEKYASTDFRRWGESACAKAHALPAQAELDLRVLRVAEQVLRCGPRA